MFRLIKQVKIDAAHSLPNHPGKCSNTHGHTWNIEVELEIHGELPPDGMVADFGDIKSLVQIFDHKCLNDIPPFIDIPPTAENLAETISDMILEQWPVRFDFVEVRVSESEGSEVSYTVRRGVAI